MCYIVSKEKNMLKRSFFKNMLHMVGYNEQKVPNITPAKARKLQKNCASENFDIDVTSTQPYVKIAEQLFHPKSEVFRAAAFYLRQIAVQNPNLSAPITDLLQNCLHQNLLSAEDAEYLKNIIYDIAPEK